MTSSNDPTIVTRPAVGGEARFKTVDADMTGIFADVPRVAGVSPARARGGVSRYAWGVLVALLVLAGGLLMLPRPDRGAPVAPPVAPAPPALPVPQAAPPMDDAEPLPPPVEVPAAPPAVRAQQAPTPRARPKAVVSRAEPRRVKPRPAVTPAPTAVVARADPEPAQIAPVADPAANCPAGYDAWCLRGTTLAVDRDLRDAYGDAAKAGVPRGKLRDIRRDWRRYRRLANKQPRALIRGYEALADDLRRAATRKAADGNQ